MKNIAILSLVLALFAGATADVWALQDDFDDGLLDPVTWTYTGAPVESGGLLTCIDGDSMTSNTTLQYENVRFLLKDVYDTRPPYTRYTLGYTGLLGGAQYLLIRNDNQPGNVLAVVLQRAAGQSKTLGALPLGSSQTHDVEARITWTPSQLKVQLTNLTTGAELIVTEFDPAWIPSAAMNFVHNANQVTVGDAWKLDYVITGEVFVEPQLDDHFDDGQIDTFTWSVSGSPLESGTLLSGDSSGDAITSRNTFQSDIIRFGIRNFFDSRAAGNYSRYTIGMTGLLGSRYILARNDIGQYAGGLSVLVSPRYLVIYEACRLSTNDAQTHDIDVMIDYHPEYLHITMEDLTTGATADFETFDGNDIPQEVMPFIHTTNTVLNGTFDLDYVISGPLCGDTGYLPEDLSRDCVVNLDDLKLLAQDWLVCNILGDPACPEFVPTDDSPAGITIYTAVPGTAVVDANLNDWTTNAAWIPMAKVYDGAVTPADAENAAFACRYDAANDLLYGAVKVTDYDHQLDVFTGYDQQDDLEIYIQGDFDPADPNKVGDPMGTWSFAQQYIVGSDGSTAWAIWPDMQPVVTTPSANLTVAVAANGPDLVYEFSCPAFDNYTGKGGSGTTQVTDLVAGKIIGFDVVLGIKSAGSFGMLCANTLVSKAYDTALYGSLVLTDGGWASYLPADFNEDNVIDLQDYAAFALQWLQCNDPRDPSCQ